MILIVQAHNTTGGRHEFNRPPRDQADARRLAARAAHLLGLRGDPAAWAGGRVVVLDSVSGRLMFVVRVVNKKGTPAPRSP